MVVKKSDVSLSFFWGYCDRGIYTTELDFDLLEGKSQFYVSSWNNKYVWGFRVVVFKLSINFSYLKSFK